MLRAAFSELAAQHKLTVNEISKATVDRLRKTNRFKLLNGTAELGIKGAVRASVKAGKAKLNDLIDAALSAALATEAGKAIEEPKKKEPEERDGEKIEAELQKAVPDAEHIADAYDENGDEVIVFASISEEGAEKIRKWLDERHDGVNSEIDKANADFDPEESYWTVSVKAVGIEK